MLTTKWNGRGELTQVGINQQYILGLRNKKRYQGFYDLNYNPDEILVYSTNVNRTIASAQAQLHAMFSSEYVPDLSKVDNRSFPGYFNQEELKGLISSSTNRINFFPIAIHTYEDRVYKNQSISEKTMDFDLEKNCKAYSKFRDENKQKPFIEKMVNKFRNGCGPVLEKHYGLNGTYNYRMLHYLCDSYIANYFQGNNELLKYFEECGGRDAFLQQCYDFESMKQFDVEQGGNASFIGVMTQSSIFRKMMDWMEKRIILNDRTKPVVAKPKYVMYSAHDTTLASMMTFINKTLNITPQYTPYGSSIFFELRKYGDNFNVEYYYNGELKGNWTYSDFKGNVSKALWEEEDVRKFCIPGENGINYKMISFVLGIVCIALIFLCIFIVIMFILKLRRVKSDTIEPPTDLGMSSVIEKTPKIDGNVTNISNTFD